MISISFDTVASLLFLLFATFTVSEHEIDALCMRLVQSAACYPVRRCALAISGRFFRSVDHVSVLFLIQLSSMIFHTCIKTVQARITISTP